MAHVADDADPEPPERVRPEVASQREEVEEGLGRVLVAAVAGVDDGGVDPRRDPVRRAGAAVAYDHRVDAHRLDRANGVEEALTLPDRGARRGERHRVGRQALGGGLERQAGARRVLVEERHDRLPAQRRDLGDVAPGHLDERVRQVE